MKLNWKNLALGVAAACVLCLASVQSFAQDPAAKLAEFLPNMTPENMADEGQVREMETAQQGWMNYCLRDCSESKELRAASIKATCDALKGDYPAPTKAWLMHVLQWVGDDSCVDTVATFLKGDDPTLVDPAARVLRRLHFPQQRFDYSFFQREALDRLKQMVDFLQAGIQKPLIRILLYLDQVGYRKDIFLS